MASKIKLRRGSAAAWIAAYPVILSAGEPGYDSTNNKIKVGDGSSEWQSLDYLTDASASLGNYSFDNDDFLLPDGTAHINAGGVGTRNSTQVRTVINKDGGGNIVSSEIAIEAGNGGFSSQVTGPWTGGADGSGGPTLVYAGVENVSGGNGPGFAGMVAIDPNVTSQYAVEIGEDGKIYINLAAPITTSTYTAALGVLTSDINMETGFAKLNGIAVTPDITSLTGRNLISMSTDRGTVLFGNQPEIGGPTHFHIMKADETTVDLFFGDDANYVKLPGNDGGYDHDYGVEIGSGGSSTWRFGTTGSLSLAGDLDVGANDGHIYIDQALAGATSIRWVNSDIDSTMFRVYMDGKEDLQNEQLEVGYNVEDGFYIGTTSNVGGLWNNPGDDHFWNFDKNGNIRLPEGGDILNSSGVSVLGGWSPSYSADVTLALGSTITDEESSVDIVIDRASNNTHWYNLFGDTVPTNINDYANVTINGSVCHDSGGNVFVLGSTVSYSNFGSNNLFLKYSPEGKLLWRKTWTDQNGLNCGSYNASLRYVEANVTLGTQDTIVWASQVPWDNISYVGTMDTDGNQVDQFGDARLPTRLDNFRVTDLVWVGNSIVGVAGQLFYPGPGYHFPALGNVDLSNATVTSTTTIMPDGTNLNYGDANYGQPWANKFKAVVDVPAYGQNLPFTAAIGTYYDGDWSHAIVSISSDNSPPITYGIGNNYPEDDIIGEDICCDNNGNVYVIVNNVDSNSAVLIKASVDTLDSESALWKLSLGPAGSPDSFYATAVAYENGYVYVLGQYAVDSTNDIDAMLIKVGIANGNVVWQRRIASPGDDGVNFFGVPGWESSSGISAYDGVVAISFASEAKTPELNLGPPELNTVTLQYPMDGSLLGTFGDFVISDFDIGYESSNYNISLLTTALGGDAVTSGFATLNATTATIDTGWTNTQWDLDENKEIYPAQTWKFNVDGSFDTTEIKHLDQVKITANSTGNTSATWTFQSNNGLRFPDGSVQYGAYTESEVSMDGGSAVTVFNIPPRPGVADGGGSSSRFGINDPQYDGNNGNNYVLDGGGA